MSYFFPMLLGETTNPIIVHVGFLTVLADIECDCVKEGDPMLLKPGYHTQSAIFKFLSKFFEEQNKKKENFNRNFRQAYMDLAKMAGKDLELANQQGKKDFPIVMNFLDEVRSILLKDFSSFVSFLNCSDDEKKHIIDIVQNTKSKDATLETQTFNRFAN